jgi:Predicted ferric reductase
VNSTGTVLVAAGRIIGMVGGFILLVQILLMSRLGWVERWIGAQEVLIWHRELGSSLLVVVLAHVFLSIFGYAASDGSSAVHETWAMATLYEDMASAFIATGLLVAISVLSIRLLRRIMPYEVWYYTHLTSYLVLLLS